VIRLATLLELSTLDPGLSDSFRDGTPLWGPEGPMILGGGRRPPCANITPDWLARGGTHEAW
jgi:hypothetical protein